MDSLYSLYSFIIFIILVYFSVCLTRINVVPVALISCHGKKFWCYILYVNLPFYVLTFLVKQVLSIGSLLGLFWVTENSSVVLLARCCFPVYVGTRGVTENGFMQWIVFNMVFPYLQSIAVCIKNKDGTSIGRKKGSPVTGTRTKRFSNPFRSPNRSNNLIFLAVVYKRSPMDNSHYNEDVIGVVGAPKGRNWWISFIKQ